MFVGQVQITGGSPALSKVVTYHLGCLVHKTAVCTVDRTEAEVGEMFWKEREKWFGMSSIGGPRAGCVDRMTAWFPIGRGDKRRGVRLRNNKMRLTGGVAAAMRTLQGMYDV